MLDTGVLALGVLADENGVDVVVGGLEALDGDAGTNVGKKVEGPAEGQVQGNVALSNCGDNASGTASIFTAIRTDWG